MMRIPLVEMRNLTNRFSASTQKRWVCRFGSKRRRVLFFAWDTLFPAIGRLPVTWHTLDIYPASNFDYCLRKTPFDKSIPKNLNLEFRWPFKEARFIPESPSWIKRKQRNHNNFATYQRFCTGLHFSLLR